MGDDKPYGPLAEMEDLRRAKPSFGVPSLFVFWAGGFSGELTDVLKPGSMVCIAYIICYDVVVDRSRGLLHFYFYL